MAGTNDQARVDLDQVQEQAGQMLQSAREQATSQLSSQRQRAVGSLGTLASVLHDAGTQARQQDEATIARYVDLVADQVDSFAKALEDQDFNQLLTSTGQFARRQPALFLAAAFAVGFAGARLLKSTSPLQDQSSQDVTMSGEDRERQRSGGYETSRFAMGGAAYDRAFGDPSGYGGGAAPRGSASEFATAPGMFVSHAGDAAGAGVSASGPGAVGAADTVLGSDWTATDSAGGTVEER
jgi:hypothetical protein